MLILPVSASAVAPALRATCLCRLMPEPQVIMPPDKPEPPEPWSALMALVPHAEGT